MEKLMQNCFAASKIHRNGVSPDEIHESAMTMAQQFWETFYDQTYNTKPMYALFDAMKHLYEMDCCEEAFGVFLAAYILAGESIFALEFIGAEKDSQELFMNELLTVSENIIEEIDCESRESFAAIMNGEERTNNQL